MKTILFLAVAAITALFSSIVNAQDFYGIATYEMKISMGPMNLEPNENLSEDIIKMIEEQTKNSSQAFELKFDKASSNFSEIAKPKELPQNDNIGVLISMGGEGESDIIYRNLKTNTLVRQTVFYDKEFLVKSTPEIQNWKLTNETKKIGDYTCYKATKEMKVIGETEENETAVLTVWYTKEIPVSHGPDVFFGLPGLVLEASDSFRTFLCSKIILNPKDKPAIVEPKKGKVVTQEAFDKIVEKKTKEFAKENSMDTDSNGMKTTIIRLD